MNKIKYRVQSDVFDIVKEIEAIDDKYSVWYSPLSKQFEIYYGIGKRQRELSVNCLDERVIQKLLSTRTTPYLSKQLFLSMDRQNKKAEDRENSKMKDKTEYQIKNMYRYLQLHNDLSGAYTDKWY